MADDLEKLEDHTQYIQLVYGGDVPRMVEHERSKAADALDLENPVTSRFKMINRNDRYQVERLSRVMLLDVR